MQWALFLVFGVLAVEPQPWAPANPFPGAAARLRQEQQREGNFEKTHQHLHTLVKTTKAVKNQMKPKGHHAKPKKHQVTKAADVAPAKAWWDAEEYHQK